MLHVLVLIWPCLFLNYVYFLQVLDESLSNLFELRYRIVMSRHILVEFTILKHEETTKPDTEMLEGKGVITGGEEADESYLLAFWLQKLYFNSWPKAQVRVCYGLKFSWPKLMYKTLEHCSTLVSSKVFMRLAKLHNTLNFLFEFLREWQSLSKHGLTNSKTKTTLIWRNQL